MAPIETRMLKTEELSYWPSLYRVEQQLLDRVEKFYIFSHHSNSTLKSVFLFTNDHKVYAFGENGEGQLGLGHRDQVAQPVEVVGLSQLDIAEIYTGGNFVMVLTTQNQLYGFGKNDKGQVGVSHTDNQLTPIMVIQNLKEVRCSSGHTVALTKDGKVWTWGSNKNNRLGYDQEFQTRPRQVVSLQKKRIIQVDCSGFISLALSHNHELFIWGDKIGSKPTMYKPHGQFRQERIVRAKALLGTTFLALTASGRVYEGDMFSELNYVLAQGPIEHMIGEDPIIVLVTRANTLHVYDCLRLVTLSSSTSIPDVFCIFANTSTPFITILPEEVRSPQAIESLNQFNNSESSDLTIDLGNRIIYAHEKVLCQSSPGWAKLRAESQSKGKSLQVTFTKSQFHSVFHYLRFFYLGSLKLELDWVFEVFSMAHDNEDDEIKGRCIQFIDDHVLPKDLSLHWKGYAMIGADFQLDHVDAFISNGGLTQANCCKFFIMAHQGNVHDLEEKIVHFVSQHHEVIFKSDAFRAMPMDYSRALLSQVVSLKKK